MELAEEVSARAGDVVDGDGELAVATDVFDGDALGALGDGALVLGQIAAVGGGGGVLGGGAAGGGQGDLDAPVDGAGLVAGVVDLGLGLALAGHGCLPLVELGELFEAGLDGVGSFLGQGLVVGVVLDVVGVPHDRQRPAVGVLGQLAGDGLELGVGGRGEFGGV